MQMPKIWIYISAIGVAKDQSLGTITGNVVHTYISFGLIGLILHFSHVRSTEDISTSGYSSGDVVGPMTRQGSLTRVIAQSRPRIKSKKNEVRVIIIWANQHKIYTVSSKSALMSNRMMEYFP